MNKYIFNIKIETDKVFNNEDKDVILNDFRARLSGYTTETPECLKGASIEITREVSLNDIAEALNLNS